MKFNVSVVSTIDTLKLNAQLSEAANKAKHTVCQQALKDCNFYCRQDQGTLIASSFAYSNLLEGVLKWHTPYAKKVYYLGTPSLDVNPNASLMWAHKAYEIHGEEWRQIFEKALQEFMKG